MVGFQPVYARQIVGRMGQNGAPVPTTGPVVVAKYTGVPGFIETVAVLGVSAAAAYTGIRTGMNKSNSKQTRGIGWVGGVGGALLGILYLGQKTGITGMMALPQVSITPPVA